MTQRTYVTQSDPDDTHKDLYEAQLSHDTTAKRSGHHTIGCHDNQSIFIGHFYSILESLIFKLEIGFTTCCVEYLFFAADVLGDYRPATHISVRLFSIGQEDEAVFTGLLQCTMEILCHGILTTTRTWLRRPVYMLRESNPGTIQVGSIRPQSSLTVIHCDDIIHYPHKHSALIRRHDSRPLVANGPTVSLGK